MWYIAFFLALSRCFLRDIVTSWHLSHWCVDLHQHWPTKREAVISLEPKWSIFFIRELESQFVWSILKLCLQLPNCCFNHLQCPCLDWTCRYSLAENIIVVNQASRSWVPFLLYTHRFPWKNCHFTAPLLREKPKFWWGKVQPLQVTFTFNSTGRSKTTKYD